MSAQSKWAMCDGKSEWAICDGKGEWAVYSDKSEWAMCVGKSEWAIHINILCGGKSEWVLCGGKNTWAICTWAMCSSEGEWAMCGGKSEWAMYGGKWSKKPSCNFCQRQVIKTVCICFVFPCRVTSLHLVNCLSFSVFFFQFSGEDILCWNIELFCVWVLSCFDEYSFFVLLCFVLLTSMWLLFYVTYIHTYIHTYIYISVYSPVKDKVVVNDRWGRGCRCQHGGFFTCSDGSTSGELLVAQPQWVMFILQVWVIKICIIMQT